jgi:hypothetical protein
MTFVRSISEHNHGADRVRLARDLGTIALVLCPVSYLATTVIRFAPLPGYLGAAMVAAFLVALALSPRGYRQRLSVLPMAGVLLAAGAITATVAPFANGLDAWAGALVGLAVMAQLGLVWLFFPWVACDLAGRECEPSPGLQLIPQHAVTLFTRTSLAFLLLVSLIGMGMGAVWCRGETRVPHPGGWALALALLTLGAMLLERLGSFERSAREGNLSLAPRAHLRWAAIALGLLLVVGVMAALGPSHAADPGSTSRTGTARTLEPASPPPPSPLQSQLSQAAQAMSQMSQMMREMPPPALPLLLLLLLLLLAAVLLWVFHRSRAARWLLWALAWLMARLAAAWRRLTGFLRKAAAVSAKDGATILPEPVWARDPLYDIFEHPDVLALLSPRQVLIRTYHLLLNVADMVGRGRRRAQTPLEYQTALGFEDAAAREALRQLTWAYVGAMYAGSEAQAPAPDSVRAAWVLVSEALRSPYAPEELARREEAYLRQVGVRRA